MKSIFYNRLKVEFECNQLISYILCESEDEAVKIAETSQKSCEISYIEEYWLNKDTNMNYMVKWTSSEALELILWLNEDIKMYNNIIMPLPINNLDFEYKFSSKDAVKPSRSHTSDSGFDLTLLSKTKTIGDVEFYTTNVHVKPPHGYYFDLVPRSSISKSGYMLANSIGIIDQSYRGDIIVPLRKVDKLQPDLELPCKFVQLIPRQWVHMEPKEVEELDETERNDGGFGSTGV